MKILLVRHGETEWNSVNRLQGQLDSPVTARGHRQIAALIRALDGEEIDRVVSSPAGRAVAAAMPIAAHFACPIRFDARLIERGFGPLEGTVYPQLNDAQRRLFDTIYSGDPHVTPPNGESLTAAAARTTAALLAAGEAGIAACAWFLMARSYRRLSPFLTAMARSTSPAIRIRMAATRFWSMRQVGYRW